MKIARINELLAVVIGISVTTAFSFGAVAESSCSYVRIVQQEYKSLADLDAWWASSEVLKSVLDQDFDDLKVETLKDISSKSLLQKIEGVSKQANKTSSDLTICYLAGHVNEAGQYLDQFGSPLDLSGILKKLSSQLKPDVILVDTCYSKSGLQEGSAGKPSPLMIFASDRNELTFALDLKRKAPLDLKKRYPDTWKIVDQKIGKKRDLNSRYISYLGFSIARIWDEEKADLSSKRGWRQLALALTRDNEKAIFRDRGLGSNISVISNSR